MDFYVAQIECARLEGYGKVSVILLVEKRKKEANSEQWYNMIPFDF